MRRWNVWEGSGWWGYLIVCWLGLAFLGACCPSALAAKPRDCLKEAERYERIADRLSIKHGEDGAGYAYLDKAVDSYLCAVKQGHPEAGYPAASLVLSQRSSRDLSNEQIETLLRGAVDKGVVGAMFTLADFYCGERGQCRQPEKVIGLLKRAAKQGDALSAWLLGTLYEYAAGKGFRDLPRAYACYALARKLGDAEGNLVLEKFENRHGVIDTNTTCY